MPPRHFTSRKPPVSAGVAGASSGTALLALVGTLPDTSHWKPLLTYAAPTISVAISAIWVFAMRRLDNWLADQTLATELKKAEAALRAIEQDQRTSAKALRDARALVEDLRMLRLSVHTNRAQAIVN